MAHWSYQASSELTDAQYARWQTLLEERAGICFLQHKSILQKGLTQRMREVGVNDYEQYFKRVSVVPEGAVEWLLLVDRISVKETSFFREKYSFRAIRTFLLDRLAVYEKAKNGTLDLWSVGCSTGEETYSLAITATDILNDVAPTVFLGVMGMDISKSALQVAREGIYTRRKIERLPNETQQRHFVELSDGRFQVNSALRQQVCFAQGNILDLERAPTMNMDLIICQNVLVYFRRERHKQILDRLAENLKPGGMLLLGPGEVNGWRHAKMRRSSDEFVQAYIKIES